MLENLYHMTQKRDLLFVGVDVDRVRKIPPSLKWMTAKLLNWWFNDLIIYNFFYYFFKHRSISSEVFYKIGGLKNFAKFTGKPLRKSLSLLIKFQPGGLQTNWKNTSAQACFCEFCRHLFCRTSANGYFQKWKQISFQLRSLVFF